MTNYFIYSIIIIITTIYLTSHQNYYFRHTLQIIYFLLFHLENLFYTFYPLKSNYNQNSLQNLIYLFLAFKNAFIITIKYFILSFKLASQNSLLNLLIFLTLILLFLSPLLELKALLNL
jgi:hypothetical protein